MPIGLYRIGSGISADGIAAAWSPLSEFYVVPAPVITGGNLPTFDRSPTLDWEAVTGAVSYEVFVRNSTTGATVHYPRNLTETSWTPPADLADGPYRWWVLATGANGVRGQWSAPIDIHVGGRPNVLSPAGTVNSSTPTINWQAVDGAVRYELWVTNMSSMVRVIYDTNLTGKQLHAFVGTGEWRLSRLGACGQQYGRVQSVESRSELHDRAGQFTGKQHPFGEP